MRNGIFEVCLKETQLSVSSSVLWSLVKSFLYLIPFYLTAMMQKIVGIFFLLFNSFSIAENVPISIHDIVVVEPSGEAVIRLKGFDLDGDNVSSLG